MGGVPRPGGWLGRWRPATRARARVGRFFWSAPNLIFYQQMKSNLGRSRRSRPSLQALQVLQAEPSSSRPSSAPPGRAVKLHRRKLQAEPSSSRPSLQALQALHHKLPSKAPQRHPPSLSLPLQALHLGT